MVRDRREVAVVAPVDAVPDTRRSGARVVVAAVAVTVVVVDFLMTTPSNFSLSWFTFSLPLTIMPGPAFTGLAASLWWFSDGFGTSPSASRFRLFCAAGSALDAAAAVALARVAAVDAVMRPMPTGFAFSGAFAVVDGGFARIVVRAGRWTAFSSLWTFRRVARVTRRVWTGLGRHAQGGRRATHRDARRHANACPGMN